MTRGQPPRRQALHQLARAALAMCATASLLTAGSPAIASPDLLRVSLHEGRQLLEDKKTLVFDIREADEHATGVASGARLLPMSQLQQRVREIPQDPAQPVLIICATQHRSSNVARALRNAGWTNVRYVHGGMSAWAQNGWPMVKPPGATRAP